MHGDSTQTGVWQSGAYLKVSVVHAAAAVTGLSGALTSVEQSTELAEEARPWHNKLHSCLIEKPVNRIQCQWSEQDR